MVPLARIIINTREDLDSIAGTPEHAQFMELLRGSMLRTIDSAVRPESYFMPDYNGEIIEPVWEQIEDFTTIGLFGFQKSDFE